jgi:hypothetical protein
MKIKRGRIRHVRRDWETVRNDLQKAGWNCGCISSTGHHGRQFWVVAAEREEAGRFIVHADEILTAFLELQAVIHSRFGTRMKYWEIIADNLSKRGWSWGCVSAIDSHGRTMWIANAHRDGKCFVVRADEKLTAFLELQRAVCIHVLTEQI